jgi:hypothetical protein
MIGTAARRAGTKTTRRGADTGTAALCLSLRSGRYWIKSAQARVANGRPEELPMSARVMAHDE